jgi:hypothetical protein
MAKAGSADCPKDEQDSRSAARLASHILTATGMTKSSTSQEIDAIIKLSGDWRGNTLSKLRILIKKADPAIVEDVKWKKPSRPEGVPVWSHEGIVCIGETLKNATRLTFPNGAQVKDPKKLFNTRLDSKTVRAIDFFEGAAVDEAALKALVLEAVRVNTVKASRR